MEAKIDNNSENMQMNSAVPPNAARAYITEMLAELCVVAKQSGQDDLHVLLKLATQAARSAQ